jgi:hypothetical protein
MKVKKPILTSLLFNVILNAAGTSVYKEAITTTDERTLTYITGNLLFVKY